MPKKEETYGTSETGNWNVASRFAEIKIMIPLEKCDFYEDVAKFGYHSYVEQLIGNINADTLKFTALERLVEELMKIAKNSMFAMKKSGTKETMDNLVKRLLDIKKILPLLKKEKRDEIRHSKSMNIDEKNFKAVLELVLDIKSEMNFPLNQNHLIFTDKEEFDPKEFKKSVFDIATTRG